jgi:hypothetical protein
MKSTKTIEFDSNLFTPTKHSTAEDKAKFCRQFVKFVKGGFLEKDFPKWFYNRLSMTFGHIAHYDHETFFSAWFLARKDQINFLKRTIEHHSFGQPEYTFCDAERVLATWVQESGHIHRLQDELNREQETEERALYERLHAKYGQS